MVSKIEPDRYADTGFAVRDDAAESGRAVMGLDMRATAQALVWATIPSGLSAMDRKRAFYERFYGEACPL